MTYWVEYHFQKGIRENLLTSDIAKAREHALMVCKHTYQYKRVHNPSAQIFSSKVAKEPVAEIYHMGGYVNRWACVMFRKGIMGKPRYLFSDGGLGRIV